MDNVLTTLAPSFLIGSSSFFQVTRTTIKAWMSLNFKYNQSQTVELTALECHKTICIDLQCEICCDHSSTFFFEWIFLNLAGKKDTHKSLNEIEYPPHQTTNYRVSCF